MTDTTLRKRLDIIVDSPLVPRIVNLIEAAGISGWSQIHLQSGSGRDGAWQSGELTDAAAKSMIITITSDGPAQVLIDSLAPFLDSYRLILTITDVAVVRGDRF
jgi:hypothetical protein